MAVSTVGAVNPDLENERNTCNFEVDEMARWWYGGQKKLIEKRELGMFGYLLVLYTIRANAYRLFSFYSINCISIINRAFYSIF